MTKSSFVSDKNLTAENIFFSMSGAEKMDLLDRLYLKEGIFKQNFEQAMSEFGDMPSIDDVIDAAKIINESNFDVAPQTKFEFKSAFERLEKRYEMIIESNKAFNWKLDTLLAAREELNAEYKVLAEQYIDVNHEELNADSQINVERLCVTLDEQIAAAKSSSEFDVI